MIGYHMECMNTLCHVCTLAIMRMHCIHSECIHMTPSLLCVCIQVMRKMCIHDYRVYTVYTHSLSCVYTAYTYRVYTLSVMCIHWIHSESIQMTHSLLCICIQVIESVYTHDRLSCVYSVWTLSVMCIHSLSHALSRWHTVGLVRAHTARSGDTILV